MPPSISDYMSQTTTILQAFLEAQSKTTEVGTNDNGNSTKTKHKWNTNDNDMPNAQHSKLRHPRINSYWHSCGYDIPQKHNSNACKWENEGHKYKATIKNKMVGLEINCFHYTCKWQFGRIDKKCSSLNQVTYKPKDLNETLSNPSLRRNNNNKNRTKKLASLIVNQHETAYPKTAATGHFVPPNFPVKTIEQQPI